MIKDYPSFQSAEVLGRVGITVIGCHLQPFACLLQVLGGSESLGVVASDGLHADDASVTGCTEEPFEGLPVVGRELFGSLVEDVSEAFHGLGVALLGRLG